MNEKWPGQCTFDEFEPEMQALLTAAGFYEISSPITARITGVDRRIVGGSRRELRKLFLEATEGASRRVEGLWKLFGAKETL